MKNFPHNWVIMQIDDGHGGVVWGKGDGKPKTVQAKNIDEINKKYGDEEVEPFKVSPGVYLIQSPPDVWIAVELPDEAFEIGENLLPKPRKPK